MAKQRGISMRSFEKLHVIFPAANIQSSFWEGRRGSCELRLRTKTRMSLPMRKSQCIVALGDIRLQEENLFKGLSLTPPFSHLSAGLTSKSCKLHEVWEAIFLSVTDT